MTDELFTMDEHKSPRLCWMEKYGVKTHQIDTHGHQWLAIALMEEDAAGELQDVLDAKLPWYLKQELAAMAETEDAALICLANLMGWTTWH